MSRDRAVHDGVSISVLPLYSHGCSTRRIVGALQCYTLALAVYQCDSFIVACIAPQMHLILVSYHGRAQLRSGPQWCCGCMLSSATGSSRRSSLLELEGGRLQDEQHTDAEEDRSNGCSGGNIVLHKHALLSRQHAVMPDGHPSLLIQLLSLK